MTGKLLSLALLLIVTLLSTPSATLAAGKGMIAVAAEGQTDTAQVSKVAARAPYYLFFNADGELVEAVANPHLNAAGGAGPQVVDFLAARGVTMVLAGEFGGKMTAAMETKNISFKAVDGEATAAVKSVIK